MEEKVKQIAPPTRLTLEHCTLQFQSGENSSLDEWLKNKSHTSEGLSARTYVICTPNENHIIGYYCISTSIAHRNELPNAKMRKGMPESVPTMLIGRLAVDEQWQGKRLGSALLKDAVMRCIKVAEIAGARAIIAHAIDDKAVSFYKSHDFIISPLGERVMMLPMEWAKKLIP